MLQSHLLLCWHGFCDVRVTLCNVIVMLSKLILHVHLRSELELAEAVLIELNYVSQDTTLELKEDC